MGSIDTANLLRDYLNGVDPTDAPQLIEKACRCFSELTGCENVLWISTLFLFCPQLSDDTERNRSQQMLVKHLDTFSLSAISFDRINRVSQLLKRSEASGKPIVTMASDGLTILPIRSQKQVAVLGYFCLVGEAKITPEFEQLLWHIHYHIALAYEFEACRQLSFIDDLTRFYNQRYLPLVLDQEMNRANRDQRKFSILFLDVDFFKHVNDTKGHLVGSRVLIQISDVIRECTRNYDYGFRYGGDEFVVVLPGSDAAQASEIAERIRESVEKRVFQQPQGEVRVTVSIGIATFPDHARTPQQVLELADKAMYYGKYASRNIVYIAS